MFTCSSLMPTLACLCIAQVVAAGMQSGSPNTFNRLQNVSAVYELEEPVAITDRMTDGRAL